MIHFDEPCSSFGVTGANQATAEELLCAFDRAWKNGPRPQIADFLPPAWALSDSERSELLQELIKIDLECRWRTSSAGPLVEEYAGRFPELAAAKEWPLQLIGEEYRARQCWGDRPSHQLYGGRFPKQGSSLLSVLKRIDAELAAEYGSLGPGAGQPPTPGPIPFRQPPHVIEKTADLTQVINRLGSLAPAAFDELIGGRAAARCLGSYALLECVGAGATGWVFKARHQRLGRLVALKVLRPELLADGDVLARFYREIEVVSRLTHPHVVHAFDAGPLGRVHALVTEYVAGADLHRVVKQSGPLPAAQAIDFTRQAALGLQHIHEHGLVHRDIKPSNLILANDTIKIRLF